MLALPLNKPFQATVHLFLVAAVVVGHCCLFSIPAHASAAFHGHGIASHAADSGVADAALYGPDQRAVPCGDGPMLAESRAGSPSLKAATIPVVVLRPVWEDVRPQAVSARAAPLPERHATHSELQVFLI